MLILAFLAESHTRRCGLIHNCFRKVIDTGHRLGNQLVLQRRNPGHVLNRLNQLPLNPINPIRPDMGPAAAPSHVTVSHFHVP
jgi:hypothetical protein